VETKEQGVSITVLQVKWDKCWRYIREIVAELEKLEDATLEFKPLERKLGFLIYVMQKYPLTVLYLKGIRQMLDTVA
jgi:hypothetical protein